MASSVETSILLLPESQLDDEEFQKTCIKTLLNVPGCISVGVHAFDGVTGPDARKRWYAVVTFQVAKVNAEQLKEVLAKEFTTEAPRELNAGMFHKIEKLNAPPGRGGGSTSRGAGRGAAASSTMNNNGEDPDKEQGEESFGAAPTSTPNENVSYYAMGDSSEDDDGDEDLDGDNDNAALDALDWWGLSDAMARQSEYDDISPSLRQLGVSEDTTTDVQRLTDYELDDDSNDGYLAEGSGTQKAVLSLMAPLVGVFGYDRARQMNEKYSTSWALTPQ